ncbi:MAG: hypothetical protein SGJ23_13275 [Alphaproteobacteria bacterium]|nr:hypothetical protein [Alphaproteobacteria bacterium]
MSKNAVPPGFADVAEASPWARRVYDALSGWEVAHRCGRWTLFPQGALMLTLDKLPTGAPCEPVNILALNDLVAVSMRRWEVQLPEQGQSFEDAMGAVRTLVRQWFQGEFVLSAFFLDDDWIASTAIDPKELAPEIGEAFRWALTQAPVNRVEVQGPQAEKDQRFGLAIDGVPLADDVKVRPN